MPEAVRMWVEIAFNIAYLIGVWWLVIQMARRREEVPVEDRPVAMRVMAAFALLALGDSGHVGFRVLAYALGGLETQPNVLGVPVSLVGLGALATAITVTLFYVVMLDIWRVRFRRRLFYVLSAEGLSVGASGAAGAIGAALLLAAAARLILMTFPANEWHRVVPPQPWSLIRNLPLAALGLGVAALILYDARQHDDRLFARIGIAILFSYACYIPVILFVQQAPAVGMLMIPKTLAYVAIAVWVYRDLYPARGVIERPAHL